MRLNAPPISELRLQRHHRWMLLWLQWFAAFLHQARNFAPLTVEVEAITHRWLDCIETWLARLIAIRVAPHVRFRASARYGARPRKPAHLFRAILGARLRRALRPRDLAARIEALSQPIAALVVLVLKRLPRGLTRRRPLIPRPAAPPLAPPLVRADACVADTS